MHVEVEANIISYCWTHTRIPSTDTLSIIPSVFLPRMCSLFSSLETFVHNTIIRGLFPVPLRGLVSRRPASVRQRARREIAHRAEDAAGGQAHPVAIAAAVADAAWLSNRTLRGDFFWGGGCKDVLSTFDDIRSSGVGGRRRRVVVVGVPPVTPRCCVYFEQPAWDGSN